MTRDGKSEASCCFASWMLEANWMVPARMRLLLGAKLNLQKTFTCCAMGMDAVRKALT